MQCAVHPDRVATKTVNGTPACHDCVADATASHLGLRESILLFVSAGYLLALAFGFVVLRGRPIVGGLAAVIALMLGRAMQVYLRPPVIVDAIVDASDAPR